MAFQGLLLSLPEAPCTCHWCLWLDSLSLFPVPQFLWLESLSSFRVLHSLPPCLLSTRGTCIGLSYLQPQTLTSLFYLQPKTSTREFMEFFHSPTMRKQMGCFPGSGTRTFSLPWKEKQSKNKQHCAVVSSLPQGREHCSSILQGCCVGKAALLSQSACPTHWSSD